MSNWKETKHSNNLIDSMGSKVGVATIYVTPYREVRLKVGMEILMSYASNNTPKDGKNVLVFNIMDENKTSSMARVRKFQKFLYGYNGDPEAETIESIKRWFESYGYHILLSSPTSSDDAENIALYINFKTNDNLDELNKACTFGENASVVLFKHTTQTFNQILSSGKLNFSTVAESFRHTEGEIDVDSDVALVAWTEYRNPNSVKMASVIEYSKYGIRFDMTPFNFCRN